MPEPHAAWPADERGRAGTVTRDYKRYGTNTLFAELNTPDSSAISMCQPRHRHGEWLMFLRLIDRRTPKHLSLLSIVNYDGTDSHPKFRSGWPAIRALHALTPTSASWLNMVECFFRNITYKRRRRDSFTSVAELELAIDLSVAYYNIDPKPFTWTPPASDILAEVTRAKAAAADAG